MANKTSPSEDSAAGLAFSVAEGSNGRTRKLGIFAALVMLLLSIFPQIDLCWRRGKEWQGAYAYAHYDEDIYAAYLNGLILGRPRRSDPLIEPQEGRLPPESLFSIQFIPPYLLAVAARATGLTAAQIYLAMPPLLAILAVLLLFYLLLFLTGDERLSCGGALFILCFGTLAGRDGMLMRLLHEEVWFAGFPFLRRYQPGLAFLLFFLFALFVWWAFTRRGRLGSLAAIVAGLIFALLVFSYFYIWTAAMAWLFLVVVLWLIARPVELPWFFSRLFPLTVIGAVTLIPYGMLLARISESTGSSQVLVQSRAPDLWRGPELIGAVVLAALIIMVRRNRIRWRDPLVLLICSFAALPFVLFNQQILTGFSLQPFHYEIFIGNYIVLLAVVLLLAVYRRHALLTWRPLSARAFIWLFIISLFGGAAEIGYSTTRERRRNLARDNFMPVTKRLNELASRNPENREVVFSPDTFVVADNIAGYAPQALLWATHMVFMPSVRAEQRQTRFFQYLYYSAVTPEQLEQRIREKSFVHISALYGYERYVRYLSAEFKPLGDDEVREKVREYADFVRAFDASAASHPALSYVVVWTYMPLDFSPLDRWYHREPAEQFGEYQLIRLKLRTHGQ